MYYTEYSVEINVIIIRLQQTNSIHLILITCLSFIFTILIYWLEFISYLTLSHKNDLEQVMIKD